MTRWICVLVGATVLAACAPARQNNFTLTNDAAVKKVLATRHVTELDKKTDVPLASWVEGRDAEAVYVYVGESHPDHYVRVGVFRVTKDGRVWVNRDPMLSEEWRLVR